MATYTSSIISAPWTSSDYGCACEETVAPLVGPEGPPEPVDDSEFGVDIDAIYDVTPQFRLASGLRNLGNALARRLITPRGGLFYDPDYGLDLRAYLNADLEAKTIAGLRAQVEAELAKDERVQTVSVSMVYDPAASALELEASIETAEGPFRLILRITAVTVEVLDEGLGDPLL